MDYFKILNLSREPFSNSPDPDFFFHSGKHIECLQKTELSLRLLRGLSVIIGDVGTGKTTLCRQLIRNFADDEKMETHLILDPHFSSPLEFLNVVAGMFGESLLEKEATDWQLKEAIKKYLFHRGVDEGKTIILIIDEGQKLPVFCLEILREFLNYETNEHKLLQIVIFAQREFDTTLKNHKNFADRINLYHILGPLNFRETRDMIRFRLERASADEKRRSFFNYPALWAIYRGSKGYPRQIINLCHRITLTVLIQNRTKAGWFIARSCAKRDYNVQPNEWRRAAIGALACSLAVVSLFLFEPEYLSSLMPENKKAASTEMTGLQTASGPTEFRQVILTQAEKKERPEDNPLALNASTDLLPEGFSEENTVTLTSDMVINTDVEENVVQPDIQAEIGKVETASIIASLAKTETKPESAVHISAPPEILGHITVTENDTLSTMIEKVYGGYSRTYLRSVTQSNERIKNPHHIMEGQWIRFPAVPMKVSPASLEYHLVHVATKDRLENAYRFLRTYSDGKPGMEMIPCWNSREGLKFVIVCDEVFGDEASARNALKMLPPELIPKATILSQWEEETVFFVNRVF